MLPTLGATVYVEDWVPDTWFVSAIVDYTTVYLWPKNSPTTYILSVNIDNIFYDDFEDKFTCFVSDCAQLDICGKD